MIKSDKFILMNQFACQNGQINMLALWMIWNYQKKKKFFFWIICKLMTIFSGNFTEFYKREDIIKLVSYHIQHFTQSDFKNFTIIPSKFLNNNNFLQKSQQNRDAPYFATNVSKQFVQPGKQSPTVISLLTAAHKHSNLSPCKLRFL